MTAMSLASLPPATSLDTFRSGTKVAGNMPEKTVVNLLKKQLATPHIEKNAQRHVRSGPAALGRH